MSVHSSVCLWFCLVALGVCRLRSQTAASDSDPAERIKCDGDGNVYYCDPRTEYCDSGGGTCGACSYLCRSGSSSNKRWNNRASSCETLCPLYMDSQRRRKVKDELEKIKQEWTANITGSAQPETDSNTNNILIAVLAGFVFALTSVIGYLMLPSVRKRMSGSQPPCRFGRRSRKKRNPRTIAITESRSGVLLPLQRLYNSPNTSTADNLDRCDQPGGSSHSDQDQATYDEFPPPLESPVLNVRLRGTSPAPVGSSANQHDLDLVHRSLESFPESHGSSGYMVDYGSAFGSDAENNPNIVQATSECDSNVC